MVNLEKVIQQPPGSSNLHQNPGQLITYCNAPAGKRAELKTRTCVRYDYENLKLAQAEGALLTFSVSMKRKPTTFSANYQEMVTITRIDSSLQPQMNE